MWRRREKSQPVTCHSTELSEKNKNRYTDSIQTTCPPKRTDSLKSLGKFLVVKPLSVKIRFHGCSITQTISEISPASAQQMHKYVVTDKGAVDSDMVIRIT
jgi:hypothetical protein